METKLWIFPFKELEKLLNPLFYQKKDFWIFFEISNTIKVYLFLYHLLWYLTHDSM